MKTPYLVLYLLLLPCMLLSQKTWPTYVFSIDADRAEYLYRNPEDTIDVAHLTEPVDSFLYSTEEQTRFPGHYLYIQPDLEDLNIELRSYHTHQLVVRNNERDLALEVIDALGAARRDAHVQFKKRLIPYDEATQTYRLKNHAKGGFLRVMIRQDTLFYDLEGQLPGPVIWRRIKYWRGSRPGYIVSTPVRLVENTYRYFRRGIGWGDWNIHWSNPLWFLRRRPEFKGYLAMSQPSYRPGDTLRIKAYLANRKGKPWSRPARLQVYTRKRHSGGLLYIADTLLSPENTAGNFVFQLPLPDSLQLDLDYVLSLDHPRRRQFEGLHHSFKLEDYELDEAEFKLTLNEKTFHRSEKIALQAEGRDQNGQFVAGAEVQLTLLTRSIDAIYADSLSVPDTLWTKREVLRDRESTQLLIPDSIFPAADLQVLILANFIHPSGELHQKEQSFTFRHHWEELILKLEQDTVVMEYQLNGRSQSVPASLMRSGVLSEKITNEIQTIRLPYREALSPFIESYELKTQGLSQTLHPQQALDHEVVVQGSWQPDALLISFSNPRRLPITWLLQTRTRQLRRGVLTDAAGTLKILVDQQQQWDLHYEFFWGYPRQETLTINRLDKKLEVNIEQPPRISPGETVNVKVKVQDQYGRPAGSVQLASAGVNSQFRNTGKAYLPPSIPYKTRRPPFRLQEFDLKPYRKDQLARQKVNHHWYRKLHLSAFPFYSMRYQDPGLWTSRDSLTKDTFYRQPAQVAPYLIRDQQAVPIYLIYLNDELVYYSGVDDNPPYSFVGRPGYNRIALRTRTAEYTLDSVWLEKGQKLELAIDPDRFRQGTQHIRLRRQPRPAYWLPAEQHLLRQRLLALHQTHPLGEQYIWSDATNIHRVYPASNRSDEYVLGPFPEHSKLHHTLPGQWEKQFVFEPGFRYNIGEKRERLYEWDHWNKAKSPLGRPARLPVPGQLIYRPEDIRREALVPPAISFDRPKEDRQPGKARLRFLQVPVDRELLAVVVAGQGLEWTVPTHRKMIGDLPPGPCRVYLVRDGGQVKQWSVQLTANTTLALDLSTGSFSPDSLRQWKHWLSSYTQVDQKNQPPFPYQTPASPYEGRGRLIQGRLTDENGEPLIGASILLQGSSTGTITDIDGNYSIWVPEGSKAPLVFSYTGFSTAEVDPGSSRKLDVALGQSFEMLSEVVVTGLGVQRSNFAGAQPEQSLQGVAAGLTIIHNGRPVTIRGNATIDGAEPLIIIDGRPASMADLAGLSPDAIREIKVLEEAEATALYGNRGTAGVILITTDGRKPKTPATFDDQEPAGGLRDQFRDYAFWRPYLMTDQNGEAYFQATYPDNITAWDTYVLGMDRKQRAGIGLARTQAWKSLTARLSVPRFMIAGDEAAVVGQSLNYTADSLEISTFFRQDGQDLYRKDQFLTEALTDRFHLTAAPGLDSISLTYGLEHNNYLDGEQRSIPVYPVGSLQTEGHFQVLWRDTAVTFSFAEDRPITVFAADNQLELLLDDLDYLKKYPHECMEQTAGRLIALCLEKQIRRHLGEKFTEDQEINKLLRRLERAQQAEGAWGWWPGSKGSLWITLHVLEALQMAQPQGRPSQSFEKGWRYIVQELPSLQSEEQLAVLRFLAANGQNLDYDHYLNPLDTLPLSLYERLLTVRIRQQIDLPHQLDTLDKYRRETLYGGYFWSEQESFPSGYRRSHHPIATTLVAYDLLKSAGRPEEARRVIQYFLEMRGIGQAQTHRAWYNTYETARVLAAILPDLLGEKAGIEPNRLSINSGGQEQQVETFPFRVQWPSARALVIQKTGAGPVYLTAYQQFHDPEPEARSDIFRISSRMIQNEREISALEQGRPATLEVSLETDADAEYIMLEIPIPAGCSYGDRSQARHRLEDHREYRREKLVIYCATLPAGAHTFRVELEPRFSGSFTLNPARAEQMYFPVLFGRNELKRINIR